MRKRVLITEIKARPNKSGKGNANSQGQEWETLFYARRAVNSKTNEQLFVKTRCSAAPQESRWGTSRRRG